jgi:uncharacterized protein YcfJ
MMKKLFKLSSITAILVTGLASSGAAYAHGHRQYDRDGGYYYNQGSEDNGYDDGNYRDDENRGRQYDRNQYRRCGKATGGLVIGAVVGGLLGREVVGRRGDRTAGTIVGAGAGALAGRALQKAGNHCR